MNIKVINQSKNELRIELIGEDHSFCNTLQDALQKNDLVEYVSYNISHPLVAEPVMYIRTNGQKQPENVLIEAAKTIEKELSTLEKTLQETFKSDE